MRSPLLAANLVFYSFSAVAQQTGSAVPPPFQAKRLPPEKRQFRLTAASWLHSFRALQDVLPPTAGHAETPVTSGTSVPPGFKPRTDVQLSKTAQDAVQMSEKWMAEHNQPLPDRMAVFSIPMARASQQSFAPHCAFASSSCSRERSSLASRTSATPFDGTFHRRCSATVILRPHSSCSSPRSQAWTRIC